MDRRTPSEPRTLSDLAVGQAARVAAVRLEGAERRRLLDLGLVPGTRVECVLRSPLGDPCAYAFRGVTVALRRPQAERIDVAAEPAADGGEAAGGAA